MWEINNINQNLEESKFGKEINEEISSFLSDKESIKEEIIQILDSRITNEESDTNENSESIKNLRNIIDNGFSIRVGDQELNFSLSSTKTLPIDDIKKEFSQIYKEKLSKIKLELENKLESLNESFETIKEKLSDELEKVKENNTKFFIPDITSEHAKRGLSIVKGNKKDEIIWYLRGTYKIKYFDDIPVSKEITKLTTFPAVMEIITNDDNTITNVKIKTWTDLSNFHHYHSVDSGSEDCWGQWNFSEKWKTPDDIINLGNRAFTILQNINSDSIGNNDPRNLPSVEQVRSSLDSTIDYSREEDIFF